MQSAVATHASATQPASRAVDILGGATMGTSWSVKLFAPHNADLHALRADFWTVLSCALDIAHASGGAFDPTVGPLVDGWGFGPPGANATTTSPEATLAHVQWRRVILDSSQRRALQAGGTRLDLCAIAKGYGVDAVAAHLRAQGVAAALVEVGGELYGYGRKPDGAPWRVIVEGWRGDEDDTNEARVLAMDGLAIATSGDRWHRREQEGRAISHTLDPRSGQPVADAPTAVTVAADAAMRADAWATALTVLGMRDGFDAACENGLAARFVDANGEAFEERMTPAFKALLHA